MPYSHESAQIRAGHDKTNKLTVGPAKTQISRASAQSDQRLHCAHPSFLHADSADSDQTGRMPRLI